MLIDRYPTEDIFARVPKMTQRIDPVLLRLDRLLEDDQIYRASSATTLANGTAPRWSMGAIPPPSKCSCACCCSSICSDGAIKRPKTA